MPAEPATVALGPLTPRIDVCELCSASAEALRSVVVVRHARAGAVQLAVCERCAAAMRRLIAVAGAATSGGGPAHLLLDTEVPPSVQDVESVVGDLVGEPDMIHEFTEPFRADDGVLYRVQAWGQGRSDGTWIGWLIFVGPEGVGSRRTPRETSQSSRDHLYYWATGVQQSYLEGAFSRAT